MVDAKHPGLREERDRTIARLSELFATDHLELDEFERQLSLAHRASSLAELQQLTATLPTPGTALAPLPRASLVPRAQVQPTETMMAVWGGNQRRGSWIVPQQLRVISVMGGTELDFREARLPAGIIDISVFAMMGGVHIVVPPTLAVDVSGSAFMGGFEHMARQPVEIEPDRPVLRVRGLVMMGGVTVETRLIGEDHRDARRRRRHEKKERRRRRRLRA